MKNGEKIKNMGEIKNPTAVKQGTNQNNIKRDGVQNNKKNGNINQVLKQNNATNKKINQHTNNVAVQNRKDINVQKNVQKQVVNRSGNTMQKQVTSKNNNNSINKNINSNMQEIKTNNNENNYSKNTTVNKNINKKNNQNQGKNKTSNINKIQTPIKPETRDTSGDTKIFQIIKKEDIEREKRLQAIKKENEEKNKNQEIKNYNNYQKNNNNTNLNNYQKNPKQNRKNKKTPLIILLIILIISLLALIFSTIFALMNQSSNKIVSGVYINNIAVSNLNKDEAIEKLNNELNNEETNITTVTYGTYKRVIHLSEIGGKFNVEKSVNEAYNIGRRDNIFTDNYEILKTMVLNNNINIEFSYDPEMLEKKINEIAIELPGVATDASYIIDGNKIVIKNSQEGIQIKTSDFKQKTIDAFTNRQISFEIPVEQVGRKEIDIEKIYNEIYKEPKDAYYTKNPPQVFKEENGLDFALSLDEVKKMLSEEKEEYVIELKELKPKVTLANLDSEAFPDRLSTFTTYYGTADAARNTNIAIAARSINSVVVMPGETFSYNDLIGECSTRTGYKESTIYLNGELSKGIGGGICQVSTTLYNAVLRANLEIVERRNHSLRVTYVPAGHDAMVSIGSQDFKFKNNRNYPVKVVAFVGTGSITCQIFGLKQDTEYEVKLVTTTLENSETKEKVQTYKVLYLNGKEIARTLLSTDTYKKH